LSIRRACVFIGISRDTPKFKWILVINLSGYALYSTSHKMQNVIMEEQKRRVSGIDYLVKFQVFDRWFSSDNGCCAYIAKLRWPKGFICPSCGEETDKPSLMECGLSLCRKCKRQTSITEVMLFHGSHKPLQRGFLLCGL